jgi:hypothetical protein
MARACRDDLPDGQSEEFLQLGLDNANQIERLQQIRFLAQAPVPELPSEILLETPH